MIPRCLYRGAALVLTFLLVACGKDNVGPDGQVTDAFVQQPTPTYVETGDLDKLKQRGAIRLIAPRFDGAEALPREGLSVRAYQRLAEEFVKQLGLEVHWVFVDQFDQLLPSLNRGEGDMVVTNLAVTGERQQQASFSMGIKEIDELVVSRKSLPIKRISDLQDRTLAVPSGTAYVSSLAQLQDKNGVSFEVTLLGADQSDSDILDAITAGEIQASVIDSDVARQLLVEYPALQTGLAIKKNRAIAWAVRSDNPELLNALNQFLVAHHVSEASLLEDARDWEQIKQSGRLRVLTLNNPASYFMWRGDLMGFDYDLIREFAKRHKLHLAVQMKGSLPELFDALKRGEGDLIAASITQTREREAEGLNFSQPYLKVSETLVGRESGPSVTQLSELAGFKVGVNPDTAFYQSLNTIKQQGVAFEVLQYPEVTTENLLEKLQQGEFDFTLADSHLVAMELAHNNALAINLTLEDSAAISWVLRPEQQQLKQQLDGFIKKEYKGLFYNVTYNKYFKNKRNIKKHQQQRIEAGQDLSPYDDLVKPLARHYGMDWRMVIAQMFQESRFNPKAKSFAGAQGLMQVLPRTGKEMGYSNLTNPEQGIKAGLAYMNWLRDRFPGELHVQERLYFTLAAYNAGVGHVRDARRLAKKLGLNPNRWFDHTEKAMLLLSQPKYHKKARFGYVRGSEPVQYVREIRDRYLGYLAARQ